MRELGSREAAELPQVWQRPTLSPPAGILSTQGDKQRIHYKREMGDFRSHPQTRRGGRPGGSVRPTSGSPLSAPPPPRPARAPGSPGLLRPPHPELPHKQDLRGGQGSWGFSNNEGQKLVPVGWNFLWAVQWDLGKEPSLRISDLGAPGRGEHAGTARDRAGGGARRPARRGPSRQAPGPPPAAGPPCLAPLPHSPSPTALSLSFFPGSARPHPVAPARRLAQWPRCRDDASADLPGLRASGSQSGRRGRPRPQIKLAGRRAALQSREWEKSRLCKQPLAVLLASLLLTSLSPPARPAALLGAQVSAWPARGGGRG